MQIPTRNEIRTLESLRKQAFWWRTGATLVTVFVVAGCLMGLNSSVRGLAQSGPRQDEFVGYVSEGMRKDVVPSLQTLASETLTEIQPQLRAEFEHINTRVPELTAAVTKELTVLQNELPKASEKTLDSAFSNLLKSREAKIRKMYPDVTEAQVQTLMTNLRTTGEKEIREANEELFAPHQTALSKTLDHLRKIAAEEAGNTKGQNPSWEMGIAVLDVVRADLKDAQTGTTSGLASPKSAAINKGGKK